MAESFNHGVTLIEKDSGPRPIRTQRSAIIGIVGTAPEADADIFPLNEPVLIPGQPRMAALLGATGTLPNSIEGIFDQAGAAIVVVRVAQASTEALTMSNVIGGVDVSTGNRLGVHALLGSESKNGFCPRILIAPGFTHQRPVDPDDATVKLANPVVSELLGIANKLRAVIIADAPNTRDADAVDYAKDFGSGRVYVIDPYSKVNRNGVIVEEPTSSRVAGVIARVDEERGFWWSPSNNEIYGIVGTGRPIEFSIGGGSSQSNLLNEMNVNTIIRQGGYRLWGNRTTSADPKFAFISVRRTADMINDAILRGHMWAVDRNITKGYLEEVVAGVNNYLSDLKAKGAILGGVCWAEKELNTAANITQGRVYFAFKFTPPYPAEDVIFTSYIVDDYLVELN